TPTRLRPARSGKEDTGRASRASRPGAPRGAREVRQRAGRAAERGSRRAASRSTGEVSTFPGASTMKYQTAVLAMLLAVSATLAASDKPRFESSPRLEAVTIDGKFDDWPGNLEPFADKPLSVQFQNDGDFLYMRFAASDPATRMLILRQGLTVWFDPGG